MILAGPTASGKTAVAHALARETGLPILSADSMLVYRGMDIGTAKPAPDDRERFGYAGVDLEDPDRPFSAGAYLAALRAKFLGPSAPDWIVCGGTGFYVECLVHGLDRAPGDPARRRDIEAGFQAGGVPALQALLAGLDPEGLRSLSDPRNPRRLVRAIETACAAPGAAAPAGRSRRKVRVCALRVPPGQLAARIERRMDRMFEEGWLDEARRLRSRPGALSATAAAAIGYREAFHLLDGRLSRKEAAERILARTRRYAKRQLTWFRGRFDADWIDASDGRTPEEIAAEVRSRMSRWPALPMNGLRTDSKHDRA